MKRTLVLTLCVLMASGAALWAQDGDGEIYESLRERPSVDKGSEEAAEAGAGEEDDGGETAEAAGEQEAANESEETEWPWWMRHADARINTRPNNRGERFFETVVGTGVTVASNLAIRDALDIATSDAGFSLDSLKEAPKIDVGLAPQFGVNVRVPLLFTLSVAGGLDARFNILMADSTLNSAKILADLAGTQEDDLNVQNIAAVKRLVDSISKLDGKVSVDGNIFADVGVGVSLDFLNKLLGGKLYVKAAPSAFFPVLYSKSTAKLEKYGPDPTKDLPTDILSKDPDDMTEEEKQELVDWALAHADQVSIDTDANSEVTSDPFGVKGKLSSNIYTALSPNLADVSLTNLSDLDLQAGFDVSIEARYAIWPILEAGVSLTHIPLVGPKPASKVKIEEEVNFEATLAGSSTMTMPDVGSFLSPDNIEAYTGDLKLYRPFKGEFYALVRPLFGGSSFLVFKPSLGFTMDVTALRAPASEGMSTENARTLNYGLSCAVNLPLLFSASLSTAYTDWIYKHTLGLMFDFRVIELDIDASLSGTTFKSSFEGSGLAAQLTFKAGF